MIGDAFVSYAQNREDVVLWRALGSVGNGFYVDVGANHPAEDSVTKAFYDRGWTGLNIEPMPSMAERLRAARPRDITIEAAITNDDAATVVFHEIEDTGISTLIGRIADAHADNGYAVKDIVVAATSLNDVFKRNGLEGREIHFLKVDVEGAEEDVLRSVDLTVWRPWVIIAEATAPMTTTPTQDAWEQYVLDGGYRFCLFDGLSRFYVAQERYDELAAALSYPACVLDDCVPYVQIELGERAEQWRASTIRWRGSAMQAFAQAARTADYDKIREERDRSAARVATLEVERDSAYMQLHRTWGTFSWKVTKPLRAASRLRHRKAA